jgi:ribosome-binding protein aMBF1 (putative translation factor)
MSTELITQKINICEQVIQGAKLELYQLQLNLKIAQALESSNDIVHLQSNIAIQTTRLQVYQEELDSLKVAQAGVLDE